MINKNNILKKNNLPYPYTIIEDFFEEKFYYNLKKYFPTENQFQRQKNKIQRMHFDTSYGDELYDNLIKNSEEYKKLHEYIYSNEFISFYMNHFKDEIKKEINSGNLQNLKDFKLISEPFEKDKIFDMTDFEKSHDFKNILYPRIDLGIGKKDYGLVKGGKGIHVDNPQRLISIIFYIGGYKDIEGGEFRVWEKINENLEIFEIIPPKENMMIISLQTNHSFHDVNPVKKITGSRNAFYMAISSNKRIWKNLVKNKINKNFNKNRYPKQNKFIDKLKLKKFYNKIFLK